MKSNLILRLAVPIGQLARRVFLAGLLFAGAATTAQAQQPAPAISDAYAESKTETNFDLTATINPNGDATQVTFEYTTDITFATGVQTVGPLPAGDGAVGTEVIGPVSNLATASTWYWRVSATNSGGTTLSAIQRIFKVAVMPSYNQGPKYAKVMVGASRNVWGRVWGGTAPYTYSFDYGDGSALVTGSVTNVNYVQTDKIYATAGTKRFTLKITDASGSVSARSGTIRVLPYQSTADRVDMAIEKGLVYLYRNPTTSTVDPANRIYWQWGQAEGHEFSIGTTGVALLAFAENEHLPAEDPVEEIYAPTATRARNFLLGSAKEINITNHTDGIEVRDSDSNDNGKGVHFFGTGGHITYSSNQAAIALIMSVRNETEAKSFLVPHGPLAGTRTYYELIRDVCDNLLWAQGDGAVRGAFRYDLATTNQTYDASTMQWPSLAIGAARDRLGITMPAWFNENAKYGFNVLTDQTSGGVGYTSSTSWRNLAKTGGALAALSFGDYFVDQDTQATLNRKYVQDRWFGPLSGSGDHAGWTGHWYAMYGLKKGLSLQGIVSLSTPQGVRDWQQDFNAWLLGDANLLDSQGGQIGLSYRNTNSMFGQQADGRWTSSEWPANAGSGDNMTTGNAILIMSASVTRAVPVAVIEPIPQQTNKPLGRSFEVDGSNSYHTDANSAIVQYLWDFDSSDGLDWDYPDATGSIVTNPGYTNVGTYTITLLVRDNANPAASNMAATTVSVTDQDVAPIAVAKPRGTGTSYAGRVGEAITLDGSDSYDPDGDAIVEYNWDLDGDGQYDDATGVTTTVTFNSPYEGSIGLQVKANGKFSNNRATLDIQAGENDLDLDSAVFTSVNPRVSANIALVLKNDPASGRAFNGVKLRLFNGNPLNGGGPIGSTYTVDFTAGETKNLTLNAASLGGAPTVWVYLDTDNSVVEFDETNNILGPFYLDTEIAVDDPNNNSMTDGQLTPTFGNFLPAEVSATRTYTIKNIGTFDLTGLAVTVDGLANAEYTVTQPAITTLVPNATTTFTVFFTAAGADNRDAVIKIASNDYDENPFDIRVTAYGIAPPTDISLSNSSIAEGNANGATVGNLTTTDGNAADSFTYTLVAGAGDTDNANFSIVGGALKINLVTDYEAKTSYTVRIRTTDSTGYTFEEPFTISVLNRNEAPVLATTVTNPTVLENAGTGTGTPAALLFSLSSLSDPDFANANFAGGAIFAAFSQYTTGDLLHVATGVAHAANAIQASGANIQISDGSSWTTVGTVDGTDNGSERLLKINLNSNATADVVALVINAIQFRNTTDNPTSYGTRTTRSYTVYVNDGNNNALAGGPASLNSNTVSGGTITVQEANDPPINTLPGARSVFEGANLTFTAPNNLSADDYENNLASVQLTVTNGKLTVTLGGGATISAGANNSSTLTLSGTKTQINNALLTLVYRGNDHYNGAETLTMVSTDGATPALSDTDTLSITVGPVNSAPEGTDKQTLVLINTPYTFGVNDFGFTDPNDTPANSFARVMLTTIPAVGRGTLQLSGVDVTAGQYITVADLNAGNLIYTPPLDVYGLDYTQITFQVEDNGGTANGGIILDATPNTLRVHVGNVPIVVTTSNVFDVTAFTARVTGAVRLYGITTSIWFEYSTDSNMANPQTATLPDMSTVPLTDLQKVLTGLNPETRYYYRLVASNPFGLVTGTTRSFVSSFELSSSETADDLPPATEIYRPMPGPVNAAGKILAVFYAYPGVAGITGSDDVFLMTDATITGNMTVLGRESQVAAGLGTMRGFFQNLLLTDNNKSIFTENFSGSGRGHTAHLLADNGALPLDIVALTGDGVAEGGAFNVLNGTPVMDGSDRIYFGNSRNGAGITRKNDSGVWYDDAGVMTLLALEGQDAGLADAGWIGNIRNDVVAGGGGAAFIANLQNDPVNARNRTLATKNIAVFQVDVDGGLNPAVVVRKGDAVTGTTGHWQSFNSVARSSTEHHLVLGLMSRKSGITPRNDQVLVAVLANGDKHLVAREGVTTIPGTGQLIDRFTQQTISTNGDVVFRGFLRNGLQVICRWSVAGGLSRVLTQGSALSSVVPVADFPPALAGEAIGLIQRMSVSPSGNIALSVVSSRAGARNIVLRQMAGSTDVEVMEYAGRLVWYRNVEKPVVTTSIYECYLTGGAITSGTGTGINDNGDISITLDLGDLDHVIRVYDDNAMVLLNR